MSDIVVTTGSWYKGYSFVEVEDIFVKYSEATSGTTMKFGPDLDTKELDLEWIIKNRPRVQINYNWDYMSYCPEEDYPTDLPFNWTTESEDGVIDPSDDTTWPRTGRVEWYVDGDLVRSRDWSYDEDWDLE